MVAVLVGYLVLVLALKTKEAAGASACDCPTRTAGVESPVAATMDVRHTAAQRRSPCLRFPTFPSGGQRSLCVDRTDRTYPRDAGHATGTYIGPEHAFSPITQGPPRSKSRHLGRGA